MVVTDLRHLHFLNAVFAARVCGVRAVAPVEDFVAIGACGLVELSRARGDDDIAHFVGGFNRPAAFRNGGNGGEGGVLAAVGRDIQPILR